MKIKKAFILITVFAIILTLFNSCKSPTKTEDIISNENKTPATALTTIEKTSSTAKQVGSETQETKTALTNLNEDNRWFYSGVYTVGVDIPIGDYYFESLQYGEYAEIIVNEIISEKEWKRLYINGFYTFFRFELKEEGAQLRLKNARMILEKDSPPIAKVDGYYPAGVYRVGKDIPEGNYYFEALGPLPQVFVMRNYSKDDNSIERSMRVLTFGYLYADEGYYLDLANVRFIPAEEAPVAKSNNGVYGEGIYLVGKDLPAGEYIIEKIKGGDDGYFTIYKNTKFELYENVITYGFIKFFKTTINLEDGNYLMVDDATFTRK